MGLQLDYLLFIEDAIRTIDLPTDRRWRMCELGNQRIKGTARAYTSALTGKQFFTPRFEHVAIDMNGLDGALPVDLNHPIALSRVGGVFDVVTNSGVSEHVADHWQCFANMDALTRIGGAMIHLLPAVGSWPKHGLRWYTAEWFEVLAAMAGYTLSRSGELADPYGQTLVAASLIKRVQVPFPDRAEFDGLQVAQPQRLTGVK